MPSLACAALACVLAGAGRAAPGLLVGMDDDTLKWAEKPQAQKTLSYARDLGIRAVRVTVPWHPATRASESMTAFRSTR